MAQMSFDTIPETNNEYTGNNVEFFNLKNDGDEAIVRILHDSTASFNIFSVHDRITVGGKFRKVNCVRGASDPIDTCPLCASGNNIVNRIFINMVQYFQGENGAIVGKPVVWERSLAYATKLKNLIDEYGPLSDCIFKIKRNGAAGSMDTTYDIFYCNPKVYRDDLYPRDTSAFDSYSALGTIILDKSASEVATFLATGSFPATQQQQQNANQAAPAPMTYQPKNPQPQSAPVPTAPPAPTYTQAPVPTAPAYVAPAPQAAPVQAPVATPPVLDNPPFDPPYTQAPAVPTAPPRRYY